MIQAVATVLDFAPEHWTPSTRIVAIAIADRTNPDTLRCFPSIRDISRRTGLGERAVQRHLRQLEAEGVIRRLGQKSNGAGSWGANVWQWEFTATPSLWITKKGGDSGDIGGVTPKTPRGGDSTDTHKRNLNTNRIET